MTKMKAEEESRQQIETALARLEIEAKDTRRITEIKILVTIVLAVFFLVMAYYFPQGSIFVLIDFLIIFFGGLAIFLSWIPTLIQPLEPENYAFRKITHALGLLEKLKEDIGYNEAYWDVRRAYTALNGLSLDNNISWYKPTNEILREFLKNLELTVLPAIRGSTIKIEHLEEIALAIYSLDPTKLDVINKKLKSESTYEKTTVKAGQPEGIHQTVLRLFRTYVVLKHALAICSSFIGCSFFYYLIVNYSNLQREYVFAATVASFFALLEIYFRRGKKEFKSEWHVVDVMAS
ncbi:MAG: hypothetical protein ABSG57_11870 [Candidatus Bathyarchaeia archaeon]